MPRGASTIAKKMKRDTRGKFKGLPPGAEKKNKVTTRNEGRNFTSDDLRQLKLLVKENTPTRVISVKMGRSPAMIRYYAKKSGVSLKPSNRSPYGPRRMSASAKAAARRNLRSAREARA